jgi:hypothetical protein
VGSKIIHKPVKRSIGTPCGLFTHGITAKSLQKEKIEPINLPSPRNIYNAILLRVQKLKTPIHIINSGVIDKK